MKVRPHKQFLGFRLPDLPFDSYALILGMTKFVSENEKGDAHGGAASYLSEIIAS